MQFLSPIKVLITTLKQGVGNWKKTQKKNPPKKDELVKAKNKEKRIN